MSLSLYYFIIWISFTRRIANVKKDNFSLLPLQIPVGVVGLLLHNTNIQHPILSGAPNKPKKHMECR
ncbi:hypothetical protein Fmac_024945 [Flemingia macrophylla]|uniref:Ycf15 n=1 Tax=Flemingia macrophylla TaxID=520843 RepID=A0ABD1LQU0_9FABA